MTNRSDVARLEAHMDSLWQRLSACRSKGDWQEYWALRRIWLSVGRLYTAELAREAQQTKAQLSLLEPDVGRKHDEAS